MGLLGKLLGNGHCECGCDKLREELREVRSEVRHTEQSLELQWESTYNKLRSVLARMNKRQERADAESLEDAGKDPPVARVDSRHPQFPVPQPAPDNYPRRRNY